jgi:hypothetical protein
MDQRQTFGNLEELTQILNKLYNENTSVALLADREGLFRTSGNIVAAINETALENATLTLDNGRSLNLTEIVAVNGIFHSDYSEC